MDGDRRWPEHPDALPPAPDGRAAQRHGTAAGAGTPRERLIAAMTDVAGTAGHEATTVERVARLAGLEPAGFYEEFDDLDSCLLAAFEAWVTRGLASLHATAERVVSSASAGEPELLQAKLLEESLAAMLGCLSARPEVARLCVAEIWALGLEGRSASGRMVDHFAALFAEHLGRLGAEPRSERAWRMLVGGVHQVVEDAVRGQTTDGLAELAPQLARHWAPALAG